MRAAARHHLTYANVIASLALFLALGGGAYAAVAIPRNSIGATQLRDRAVTPKKLSASTRKLLAKAGATGAQGNPGIAGGNGTQGAAGPAGSPGARGPSDSFVAGASSGQLTTGYTQVAAVTVPAGSHLLGAKATLFTRAQNSTAVADCILGPSAAPGLSTWDQDFLTLGATVNQLSAASVSLVGAATFGAPQTVVLACRTTAGAADFGNARVWAQRTDTLHGAPLPID